MASLGSAVDRIVVGQAEATRETRPGTFGGTRIRERAQLNDIVSASRTDCHRLTETGARSGKDRRRHNCTANRCALGSNDLRHRDGNRCGCGLRFENWLRCSLGNRDRIRFDKRFRGRLGRGYGRDLLLGRGRR